MSWCYRHFARPILFTQDAESIHERTMRMLGWAGRHELVCEAMNSFLGAQGLPIELFGLRFPNPVGLAAGMDKEAAAVPAWAAMGFGFANSARRRGSRSRAIHRRDCSARSPRRQS